MTPGDKLSFWQKDLVEDVRIHEANLMVQSTKVSVLHGLSKSHTEECSREIGVKRRKRRETHQFIPSPGGHLYSAVVAGDCKTVYDGYPRAWRIFSVKRVNPISLAVLLERSVFPRSFVYLPRR